MLRRMAVVAGLALGLALPAVAADKGMVLVTVNCDQAAPEGIAVMRRTPIPGTHLHQPGGLEGKICVEQGLMVLPHLVVIAKDGKVAVGNAQLAILEDDVNKLTK